MSLRLKEGRGIKRTPIQQEVLALIKFYEAQGKDWTSAAGFVLIRDTGIMDLIAGRNGWTRFRKREGKEERGS